MTTMSDSDFSPPSRTSLSSWWKQFKQKQQDDDDQTSEGRAEFQRPKLPHMSHSSSAITTTKSNGAASSEHKVIPPEFADSPIFGVALNKSIKYANVSISLSDPSGEQFVYGYIPIVVAKCGVYLKKNATTVEGIFRLSGSARRIKELQAIFNSPPRFGKGLDWSGFNVHDAANVLRRYLNNLTEPIIPLYFYQQFREPLKEFSNIVNLEDVSNSNGSTPAIKVANEGDKELINDINAAVDRYQTLISQLPQLNRQLLMYILDLLSIFAAKADENRMPASNLAAIFQPSLLSHPDHDMVPEEYHLSRAAIEFLIQHSNKFLSHIESIAIRQHEEEKKKRKSNQQEHAHSNNSNNNNNNLTVPITRRHSKSLSSVGGQDPPPIDSLIVPKKQDKTNKQRDSSGGEGLLSPEKEAKTAVPPRANPGAGNSSPKLGDPTTEESGGLLTSLKRSVSFTRKPSLKHRSSGGSNSSQSPPQGPRKNLSRNSSAGSPEIPEEQQQQQQQQTTTRQQSVVIPSTSSNPSIDQALASSPAASDSLHPYSASPRVRNLNTLLTGANDSNSSLSGITKTMSGSSMDPGDESDDDQSGGSSRIGRHRQTDDPTNRRNVSKWRRSLMLFSSPSESQNEISDLLDPPESHQNEPSGMSSSPSKMGGWFKKMRSRDRSLGRTDSDNNTDD